MPEHLRALVVILVLSGASFWLMRPGMGGLLESATFRQWRNLWLGLTLVAFLSHSFWLFALVVSIALLVKKPQTGHVMGVWFLLLCLIPARGVDVPGFGLINYLFTLNHLRLLSLVLLLPAAMQLQQQRASLRMGRTWPDKFLLIYLVLVALLQLREDNITSALRGCFDLFVDVLLPYYVASRSLRTVEDFKHAFTGLFVAAGLLGILAMFETLRHWNLFQALTFALGLAPGFAGYLPRDDLHRAAVSLGQPIPLGLIMMLALSTFLYLRIYLKQKYQILGFLVLMGGLGASLSRGPWVGLVFAFLVYLSLGPKPLRTVFFASVLGILALGVLTLFSAGQKFIDLLPYIGAEDFNVTYRERLLENSWIIIDRNFWFGSVDYLDAPEMQSMIQGQGIIDIVNTYVGVALDYGIVGLGLFCFFFLSAGGGLFIAYRRQKDYEIRLLCRSMIAALAAVLLTIFTVSSISVIPYIYWSLAGICVALAHMKLNQESRLD